MDLPRALTGPLGQRLVWTLLHFLWQGAVLAVLLEAGAQLSAVRSIAVRYRLSLATLALMAVCPLATFWLVRPEPAPAGVPQPAPAVQARLPHLPKLGTRIKLPLPEAPEGPPAHASANMPAADQPAAFPPPQVPLLVRWQPWLLAGWAIGAGLFGVRLLIGGMMAWRVRRGGRPLDGAWAERARHLALRMGLPRARVFVSERVRQGLVAGLWRPMVLLPAAWLMEMPPELLEAALAHELAHLRRLDLWAIHLQRLVETFLFYHPAVWWLSRRLDRQREMCCDEMAVAATGDRLAFTKALQWAVQGQAARRGAVLGAAWKGSRKMVLERIRRVLGAESRRERCSWWPVGLTVVAVAALLMFSALFAKEAESVRRPGDRTPTLAEIAKANDATWAAIRSADMEYETACRLVVGGKTVREVRCPGARWSKEGDRERDHGRFAEYDLWDTDAQRRNDFENIFQLGSHTADSYWDGKNMYEWDKNALQYGNSLPRATISPQRSLRGLKGQEMLHFIVRGPALREMTLSELIAAGGVTIKGRQTSKEGDTLWILEVDDPQSMGYGNPYGGKPNPATFTRIYVNADKGFLISRIVEQVCRSEAGHSAVRPLEEHAFREVTRFADCGRGVFFPAAAVRQFPFGSLDPKNPAKCQLATVFSATRLSVNAPLPPDAFDFRFPENAVVHQIFPDKTEKDMLWGADNKPAKAFATEKECRDFERRQCLEEMRKEVERKRGSKESLDLGRRSEDYFAFAKVCCKDEDFGAALWALAAIAADPKSQRAGDAHVERGLIYLSRRQDFAAAAEFSQYFRWSAARGPEEQDDRYVQRIYLLRGMAYANQEDCLDQAVADMTTAIQGKPCPEIAVAAEIAYAARLLRGAIYLNRSRLGEALADLDVAIEADPKQADAYAVRHVIHARRSDAAKAEADRVAFLKLSAAGPKDRDEGDAEWAALLHRCLLRLVPQLPSAGGAKSAPRESPARPRPPGRSEAPAPGAAPAVTYPVEKAESSVPPVAGGAVDVDPGTANAIAAIEKLGGKVNVEDDGSGKVTTEVSLNGAVSDADLESLQRLPNVRRLWLVSTSVTDAGLEHVERLSGLENLLLFAPKVTDAGIKRLKGLKKLYSLNLDDTPVTDAGLRHLQGLTDLRFLSLERAKITDAGLQYLEGLTKLRSLSLSSRTRTKITDAGLAHLKGLTSLQTLNLGHSQVTDAGVDKLQRILPKCKILVTAPTVDLKFTPPFDNDRPLLEKPVKNDWVRVERATTWCGDCPPKLAKAQGAVPGAPATASYVEPDPAWLGSMNRNDSLSFVLGFNGKKKDEGRGLELVEPYKLAFSIVVQDKQGGEHKVADQVVEFAGRAFVPQIGIGWDNSVPPETTYQGVFDLPMKLTDVMAIRVRLEKVRHQKD